jgi:hypothetical protein
LAPSALPRLWEVGLLLGVRALAGGLAWWSGFRALSDDDYARTVIAERFAESASLDPSGTSWLPLPFWIYGSAFKLFGSNLTLARGVAIGLGALATLGVYIAARWLGACRPGALLGAAAATLIPWSARLGIAPLPEVPSAACILLGAAALGNPVTRIRLLGATALGAASLSRYEAWPVCVLFAAVSICDAIRSRNWRLAGAATLALAGPCAWILHGIVQHGDALFFVARVTAYRHALGGTPPGLGENLFGYPLALVRSEPELFLFTLLSLGLTWRAGRLAALRRHRRAALAIAGVVGFLIVSNLRGAAPTHHAERALLPAYWFFAVVSGDLVAHVFWAVSRGARHAFFVLAVALIAAGAGLRDRFAPHDAFADRRAEEHIGERARSHRASALLVDTPDFGFFAALAAFGTPSAASAVDDRDPRRPRPADAFASTRSLTEFVAQRGARWLITTREHAALARSIAVERDANERFVLLELVRRPGTPFRVVVRQDR